MKNNLKKILNIHYFIYILMYVAVIAILFLDNKYSNDFYVVLMIVITYFFIKDIFSFKRTLNNYSKYEINIIMREYKSYLYKSCYKALIVTNSYVISRFFNKEIIRKDDIVWIYPKNRISPFNYSGTDIIIYTKDSKKHDVCIGRHKNGLNFFVNEYDKPFVNDVLDFITYGNPNILVGKNEMNYKIAKERYNLKI